MQHRPKWSNFEKLARKKIKVVAVVTAAAVGQQKS